MVFSCVCGVALAMLCVVNVVGRSDRRLDELARMGSYESVDITFDGETSLLSFDGFGNHYKVILEKNERMVMANIKHLNDDYDMSYVNSMTESCHYFIKRNTNSDTPSIHGSVSICDKRGVRGMIHGFNETIVIRPANYYLDVEFDSGVDFETQFYKVTDKHLIYRVSDFNHTGIEFEHMVRGKKVSEKGEKKKKSTKSKASKALKKKSSKSQSQSQSRKLLAADNVVELLAICDPDCFEYYDDTYSSDKWYSQLVSDFSDYISSASYYYEDTNWGNDVGDISIDFANLFVVEDWAGDYRDLEPDNSYSDDDLLDALTDWLEGDANSIDNTYDNTMLFTYGMDGGGLAWMSTMCDRSGYSSSVLKLDMSYSWLIKVVGHEMGHNFGADHDQDTPCGTDGGIMGYGDNLEEYSSCSIEFFQEFFDDESTSCLTSDNYDGSIDGGGSSDDSDDSTDTTWSDDSSDDSSDYDCDYYDCVGFWSFDNNGYNWNKYWEVAGCYNGEAYYTTTISGDTWYLYWGNSWGGWHAHTSFQNNDAWLFCYGDDLVENCGYDYDWYNWDDDEGWYYDTSAFAYECSSGMVSNGAVSVTDDDDDDSSTNGYILTENCTNSNAYGDSVCIYNSGSLWSEGLVTFTYDGCKDDSPMFYATISKNASEVTEHSDHDKYYLHYESDSDMWALSLDSIYANGEALCRETLLTDCTYNAWEIKTSSDDEVYYTTDSSMGYSSNCVMNTDSDSQESTDDDSAFCSNNDDACALWNLEMNIIEESGENSICTDSYVKCMTIGLESSWVSDVSTNLECFSHYSINVKLNVSFSDINGEDLYSLYSTNYSSILQECNDGETVTMTVASDELTLCSDCSEFGASSEETNEESGVGSLSFSFSFSVFALIGTIMLSMV